MSLKNEIKKISSETTLFAKCVSLVIWILIAQYLIGMLVDGRPESTAMWLYLVALIVGIAITWGCTSLKTASLDSSNLYVSNYLQDITIPLTMIDRVTENRGIKGHRIIVHFHGTTKFGSKIKFIPANLRDPIVKELTEASSGS